MNSVTETSVVRCPYLSKPKIKDFRKVSPARYATPDRPPILVVIFRLFCTPFVWSASWEGCHHPAEPESYISRRWSRRSTQNAFTVFLGTAAGIHTDEIFRLQIRGRNLDLAILSCHIQLLDRERAIIGYRNLSGRNREIFLGIFAVDIVVVIHAEAPEIVVVTAPYTVFLKDVFNMNFCSP